MDPTTTDAQEWALALGGSPEAFSRVFRRHRDRVFRHSLRLVPRPADADDAVAVVFFEAWRRREKVRFVSGSLLPWLLVTATNVARNLRRSSYRYRQLLDGLPTDDHAVDPSEVVDEPASTALRGLSANDQRVITLCVLEGYDEASAAEVLGIARGTVKSRLFRAKQRLAHAVRLADSTGFTMGEVTQ